MVGNTTTSVDGKKLAVVGKINAAVKVRKEKLATATVATQKGKLAATVATQKEKLAVVEKITATVKVRYMQRS